MTPAPDYGLRAYRTAAYARLSIARLRDSTRTVLHESLGRIAPELAWLRWAIEIAADRG